ncbi:ABC transporter permease subunit [Microbacterium sp. A82]
MTELTLNPRSRSKKGDRAPQAPSWMITGSSSAPQGIAPSGYTPEQTIVYAVIVCFLAPFLRVIPVMTASITASSSFVGEKERRTIEGLLYTPLTYRKLVLAKVLGSVIKRTRLSRTSWVLAAQTPAHQAPADPAPVPYA